MAGIPLITSCDDKVWNAFHLNANGNITFGAGDADATPTEVELLEPLPRIAAAWGDLNPASRNQGFLNTFPIQALGFSSVNGFVARWINVPEAGREGCGSKNTFSILLFDDGLGKDENSSAGANEGPTARRRMRGAPPIMFDPPRFEGEGIFAFQYSRMDLLGTPSRPVIAGYSNGDKAGREPLPRLENLSESARQTTGRCLSRLSLESRALLQVFNSGTDVSISAGGVVSPAIPSFDLRSEGNDAALCKPFQQVDSNLAFIRVSLFCDILDIVLGPADISSCGLERNSAGKPLLTITGFNFKQGALVMISGRAVKIAKYKDPTSEPNTFRTLVLKGKLCGVLPGVIVVSNPGGITSRPFNCNKACQ